MASSVTARQGDMRTQGDMRHRAADNQVRARVPNNRPISNDKFIELVNPDGSVTTICQRADGTIEVHTAAMAVSGQAIGVPVAGSVQAVPSEGTQR
ncbi:hypothetical protein DFR67_10543 [Williamsia limnetica]|uniref:Uncharacterized protein n=1 Tax=Williamsia limnetica TaxID=882452 RepID=A0A318RP17_WILLI|nr:hypothetical protein [Williamsia limnetica]PYE17898.1 hypothetical protein DFR67_10543 [Williamsia limnetica]